MSLFNTNMPKSSSLFDSSQKLIIYLGLPDLIVLVHWNTLQVFDCYTTTLTEPYHIKKYQLLDSN